jgi:hypothetical protein
MPLEAAAVGLVLRNLQDQFIRLRRGLPSRYSRMLDVVARSPASIRSRVKTSPSGCDSIRIVMLLGRGSPASVERAGFIRQVPKAAWAEPDAVSRRSIAVVHIKITIYEILPQNQSRRVVAECYTFASS